MNDAQGARFLALRKQYITRQFGRLNDMQQDAVHSTQGPLLILAGAGSGKTTVLVNRIANMVRFGTAYSDTTVPYGVNDETIAELETIIKTKEQPSDKLAQMLCKNPVRPYRILAITFTNKAAGELKNRLEAMLGAVGQDIHASTFHSSCVRILRRDAERLGYPSSFTIYDTDDQKRAMKEVYKIHNIDEKMLPLKVAIGSIGRLKDKMISPQMALQSPADSKEGMVAKIYAAYAKRLRDVGAMDFDDLIYQTVLLLREHEDVREYYQNRFQYVLVDEYQDTSIAQFQLVYLLGSAHQNVCVVGDDDQSIYRFRGATIENILNFEQHFSGAKVIRLEQNYRSTSNILNAANGVIGNNHGRKGKTLWTENGAGEKIQYYAADSEFEEAAHLASAIGEHVRAGAKLGDHAVLYRMNAQSGPIETYFARAGIPYKIIGGNRFYDRKEIKDIIAYMSIVVNRQDDLRLKRIINEPARKIGLTTVDLLTNIATQEGIAILDVLSQLQNYPQLARASSALNGFMRVYQAMCAAYQTLPMDEFVSEILQCTGYLTMLKAQGDEGATRLENIGQLVSSVKAYADQRGAEATLAGFLEEVALISDLDSYDESADVVLLMTMHSAKGLEFDYVFIVGMEEGIFPGEASKYSDDDMEEERRLCYVGLTRAKKVLNLSSAASRMMFGQTKRNRPSRFLDEIDTNLMESELSAAAKQAQVARERYQQQQNQYVQRGYTSRPTVSAGAPSAQGRAPIQTRPIMAGGKPRNSILSQVQAQAPKPTPVTTQKAVSFKAGDVVDHKVFGRGTVRNVTPVAGDHIVEIQFTNVGIKKTMANYAPLTLVEKD